MYEHKIFYMQYNHLLISVEPERIDQYLNLLNNNDLFRAVLQNVRMLVQASSTDVTAQTNCYGISNHIVTLFNNVLLIHSRCRLR